MTQKFGRTFRLTVDPADGQGVITITLPFTVNFWIERNKMADLNRFSIDIHNLAEATRSRIFQDRFDLSKNRTVTFEAGYSNLYRIFSGRIFEANSSRDGTSIITRIEARDGQYDTCASQINQTVQSGKTLADIFRVLIGEMPNLSIGAVGDWPQVFNRPVVLNGNTWNLIKSYSGNKAYIDNNKVYVLQENEVVKSEIPVINDSTGLLETPRRDEGFLSVTTLLEPGINLNQLINLQSTVQTLYNGQYSVCGIKHRGTISSAVCGSARSTFSLLHPEFFQFKQVPGQ